jgi:hypothetical protein
MATRSGAILEVARGQFYIRAFDRLLIDCEIAFAVSVVRLIRD